MISIGRARLIFSIENNFPELIKSAISAEKKRTTSLKHCKIILQSARVTINFIISLINSRIRDFNALCIKDSRGIERTQIIFWYSGQCEEVARRNFFQNRDRCRFMLIWTSQSTLYRYYARAYVSEKERFSGNTKLRVYITVCVSLQYFLLSEIRRKERIDSLFSSQKQVITV